VSASLVQRLLAGATLLLAAGVAAAASDAPQDVAFDAVTALPADPPDAVEAYGPDPRQRREFWLPDGAGPHPALFLIHGGCWLNAWGVDHVRPLATALRDAGWVVVAPEYRRVGDPGGGWAGTLEDVGAAWNGLLDGVAIEHVDPERIVLAGHAAGGHLALWLAARRGLDAGDPERPAPPTPARVIGLAAIADPETYARGTSSCERATRMFLGGMPEDVPERYVAASPVRLPAPAAPVVLLEGGADAIVPAAQGEAYERVHEAERIVVPGAGHFDWVHPGTPAGTILRRVLGRTGSNDAP
jgi:acetyl esterase/lipase